MIRRHERGHVYPGLRYRRAYMLWYGASAERLGFRRTPLVPKDCDGVRAGDMASERNPDDDGQAVPADTGLEQLWTDGGLAAGWEEVTTPVERRRFLTLSGAALAFPVHEWLVADPTSDLHRIDAALAGHRVDSVLVADLTTRVDALRRMDDALGGGAIHDLAVSELRLVVALIRHGRHGSVERAGLHAVVAELARLVGWAHFDTGNHGAAQRCWLVAVRAAHEAGQPAIAANVLRCMAGQERALGDPCSAIRLLRSALTGARGAMSATERAVLAVMLARSYGDLGDRRAVQTANDQVYALIEEARPEQDPPWAYWIQPHAIAFSAGDALVSTGRAAEAVPHLRRAVGEVAGFPRDRILYLTRLGTAHVDTGEIDQAIEHGHEAIACAALLDSGSARANIRSLCQQIQATGHPAAVDLTDHAWSVLATALV
ncbi:XRE family transcriptional regulator [Frankia sp. CiP3]|uniref:XRE family transcriptional regulator n=1 Tax=Frankia sp. CiP3 TaxID=2880971 RepID=UPI001EF400E0|nr:XRE family transcriptional regulator [Frankia sp. CiP3]